MATRSELPSHEMHNPQGSKAKLINATIALLATKGYESTGINEILEMAHVSKSNFYYHFKSKEELCLTALDRIAYLFFNSVIQQTLGNKNLPPRQRIERHFDYLIEVMETQSCDGGCVFTNLATETSDFYPAFREKLDEIDHRMTKIIEGAYVEGMSQNQFRSDVDAFQMAQLILSLYKGTMVLSKSHKTADIIRQNRDMLFQLIIPQAGSKGK